MTMMIAVVTVVTWDAKHVHSLQFFKITLSLYLAPLFACSRHLHWNTHLTDWVLQFSLLPLTVNPWLVCHCCCLILLLFARDNLTNSPTTNFSTPQLGCHIVFETADVLTVLVCLIISSRNLPLIGHTMTFKLINSNAMLLLWLCS